MAPSPGISASSAKWTNVSVATFPCLTSGIDPLPEGFDAKPLHGINEKLVGTGAQREIGFDNILDHVSDFTVGHRRANQRSHSGLFFGTASHRHLINLLAF